MGVGDRPCRWCCGFPVPLRAWGDLHFLCGEHSADLLDPGILCTPVVDELDYQRRRGSSSLAKKIGASFRISSASLRSRTSRSSSLRRCCSAEVAPRTWLASIWACLAEVPRRFGADTEFRAYRPACGVDGLVFVEVVEDHPNGSLTLLGRVTLRHDLHPSQERMRHQTRHDSC